MPSSSDNPLRSGPATARPPRRRWRTYSISGIAGLTMLAGQCAPQQCAPAPVSAPLSASVATPLQQVIDLTNAERAKAGLGAVSVDQRLMNAAQAHSADQAARGTMSHTGGNGSNVGGRISSQGYVFQSCAENVAWGYPDAASVVAGWMGSAGHKANILGRGSVHIGVGLAYSADGSPYWTQVFAAPR